MSLIEETKPKLSPEVLQSMCRVNVKLHDEISRQMAEFERKNKITVVPMGATALKLDIPQSMQKSIDRSQGKGAAAGGQAVRLKSKLKSKLKSNITDVDNSVKRNKTVKNSGHQNIILRKSGTLSVQVGPIYCGSFKDKEEALDARDTSRERQGLPKLERTE
jgi:hypothetical protein